MEISERNFEQTIEAALLAGEPDASRETERPARAAVCVQALPGAYRDHLAPAQIGARRRQDHHRHYNDDPEVAKELLDWPFEQYLKRMKASGKEAEE